MKAIPFPQANDTLKAPPSRRDEILAVIESAEKVGADVTGMREDLDAAIPEDQEVYDLPIWRGLAQGAYRAISCWEPSPEERALIAAGGPVWLWVVGHTHPPLAIDAASPFEEHRESPPSILLPEEALALAGKLLARLADAGRLVSLRAVREQIPLEPEPILEGAKATCQRHRKGRLFILMEEVAGEPGEAREEQRPTVAESFRELLERQTLTPEEQDAVRLSRDSAPPREVQRLLAIIDRLTGRLIAPEWTGSQSGPVDTSAAEEEARRLMKAFPLPYRPGGEADEP